MRMLHLQGFLTMLDRTLAPKILPIQKISFPKVQNCLLDNGIPMYALKGGSQEVIKLEMVFDAGRSHETTKLASKASNQLLKEGTSKYSSEALAEEIDFYGSTISCHSGMDHSSITLYCLKKHFYSSLHLVSEILNTASFPKNEIAKYGVRASERLQQQLSKNSVIAYRHFSEKIFGSFHPYGYNTVPEDYNSLNRDVLVEHYQNLYAHDNCRIYLSGFIDDEILRSVNTILGSFRREKKHIERSFNTHVLDENLIEIPGNKLQNSIKLGRKLFSRNHPDYFDFLVLNTILGGYFGSRLMSVIREEKGYTYSIYSVIDPLKEAGSFYVSTEVGKEYYEPTIQTLRTEFNRIQNDLVSSNELQMAKNYLLGNFLSMLDGPLKSSKVLKMLKESHFDISDFDQMIETIKMTSPKRLIDLAQAHLDFDKMLLVSVGDF